MLVLGFDDAREYSTVDTEGLRIVISEKEALARMPAGTSYLPLAFFVRPDTEQRFGARIDATRSGSGRVSTGPATDFVGCTYLDIAIYWDVSIGYYVSHTAPGLATQWVAVTENTNFWNFNRSTVTGSFQQCIWYFGCTNTTTWVRIDSNNNGSCSLSGG
jgi:hypothetical protein